MESRCSVVAVALMLLAVGGGGVFGNLPPGVPSSRLSLWRPTDAHARDLDRRMQERLADLPAESEWRDFTDIWMSANMLSADPARAATPEAARANREALVRLEAFRSSHSDAQYVALGAFLAVRFGDGLARIADGLAQADDGAVEWLEAHASDEPVKTVRALSGAFPEVALSSGILRPARPADADRLRVARLLWLERWLIAGGLTPYPRFMTSAERALAVRWKVEDSEHLAVDRRLQLLSDEAGNDPAYPVRLVAGVLFYREGRTGEARTAFLESLADEGTAGKAEAWLLQLRREQF